MTSYIRCDGCGADIRTASVDATRCEDMLGDDVPPAVFHWCRLCSRAAFRGVLMDVARRRRGPLPEPKLVRTLDQTREMPGGVDQVQGWMRRRHSAELEETRVVGEGPR